MIKDATMRAVMQDEGQLTEWLDHMSSSGAWELPLLRSSYLGMVAPFQPSSRHQGGQEKKRHIKTNSKNSIWKLPMHYNLKQVRRTKSKCIIINQLFIHHPRRRSNKLPRISKFQLSPRKLSTPMPINLSIPHIPHSHRLHQFMKWSIRSRPIK